MSVIRQVTLSVGVSDMRQRLIGLMLLGTVWAIATSPVAAQEEIQSKTLAEWIATRKSQNSDIAQNVPVQVTGVSIFETDAGLEIVLETAGQLSQPTTSVVGNTLIADIPNAVLNLQDAQNAQFVNPTAEIASLSVTNLPNNQIRVAIEGVNTPPTAQVSASAQELILTVTPGSTADLNEEIEILVTGDRITGYRAPNATTATRTDTPLRDVPANIQVVPRQVFEDQGAFRLDEALRNVANVNFASSYGNRAQEFQVRGFIATQYRNGFREDTGACCSFNNRTAPETADLERVEVLKGPASVLFGQGEPGGIINLVTKQPLDTPYYEIGFTAGSFNFYRPTLDFSGPLSGDGSLAYRLNVAYESDDTFRDLSNSRRYFIAPTLAWQISPSTALRLEASYIQDRRTFDRGLIVLEGSDRPADLPLNRALFDPENSITNIEETRVTLFLDHQFADNLSLRSALRYTTSFESDREGTSNVVALLPDNRTVELEAYFGDQYFETFTFQNDLIWEFNTGSIAHTLLFGLKYRNATAEYSSQVDPEPQALTGGLLDIFEPNYDAITYTGGYQFYFEGDRQKQNVFAVYLQNQISLLDNLKLLVGGRFDHVTSEQRFGDFSEDGNDSAFSPRVGIVYQPTTDVALYASYSRSFVPAAGRSIDNEAFEPERGTQYEIGVKFDLIAERLSATLSAFDITKSNVLTANPVNTDFSIQVGEQKSRGIELDVTGEILPGWNIIASYAYLNAQITEDNTYEVGNRLNPIPQNSASLWTTYTIQSGSLRGMGFGAGVFFVDQRPGDLDNSFFLPDYTRVDAAIYYDSDDFRAALNFKNLFDTEYFAGSQNRAAVVPGAPFEVQGTVSWQF